MSFKTPILCDRRVYDKKGKWKSPNNDHEENIFYFIKENLTLVPSYKNGIEELKETITITQDFLLYKLESKVYNFK